MKIDKPVVSASVVSLPQKADLKKQVEEKKEASSSASALVDTRLSQSLQTVVEQIQSSPLSAGDVHSKVKADRVAQLLNDSPVNAVRPQVPAELLLQLADKVSLQMQKSPEAAVAAFKDLQAPRVLDLI
jgi:hypothetical protein